MTDHQREYSRRTTQKSRSKSRQSGPCTRPGNSYAADNASLHELVAAFGDSVARDLQLQDRQVSELDQLCQDNPMTLPLPEFFPLAKFNDGSLTQAPLEAFVPSEPVPDPVQQELDFAILVLEFETPLF